MYRYTALVLFFADGYPAIQALLSVFAVVPRCARDVVYDAVARNRYRMFGTNGGACKLPDKVLRKRMGRSLPPELLENGGGGGGGVGGSS